MKKKIKKNKKTLYALLSLFAMLVFSVNQPVCAASENPPDSSRTGSISILTLPENRGTEVYEGTLSITRVVPQQEQSGIPVTEGYVVDKQNPYSKTSRMNSGEIYFGDLQAGFYLVEQVSGSQESLEPFVVSVPMADSMDSGVLLWDIKVSPKFTTALHIELNHITGPARENTPAVLVRDSDRPQPGTMLWWEIRVKIPEDIAKASALVIDDELDGRIQYEPETLNIFAMDGAGNTYPMSREYFGHDSSGPGRVHLRLNQKGLEYLSVNLSAAKPKVLASVKASDSSLMLYIQFGTHINLNDTNAGQIPNRANIYYKDSKGVAWNLLSRPSYDEGGTDIAEAYDIHLTKLSAQGVAANPLQGASFKLYFTEKDAKAGGRGINSPGTETEWVISSGADGKVYFNGLAEGVYWLAETVVPEGMKAPEGPFQIVLSPGGENITDYVYISNVLNIKDYVNIPNVPNHPEISPKGLISRWGWAVKTGDRTRIGMIVSILLIAAGVCACLFIWSKCMKRKE